MKPLWSHQEVDKDRYLTAKSLFNTSDCGTGKSRTIIEVIKATRIKTLILAPKSILQCAWGNDIEEYAPELTYSVAYATNRADAFAKKADIYITNIDAVTWLHKNPKYLAQFNGGFLVVDESTAIKNPSSLRTKAAMAIRPIFAACTCMSGTPTPQGIIDIWSQIFMVDQGQRLGNSFYRFRNNTYTPEKKGNFTTWKEKEGMADAVADLIADITIRNRREDCMDLPPNHVVHRRIALSPTHMRKYQELKKRALVELDSGDVSAVNAAVLLTKLLQLTSGAVYDEFGEPHLVSTDRYELITELVAERSQSVVVFNWRHQRDELIKLAEAEGFKYGLVDGSVTANKRTEYIKQFQAGELKVMYVHPASAAHGITLTKGVATIWASPTYNAEHFEQANARIYRGGQTQTTETILISADGTAEQDVYKALYDKRTNMHNLLEVLR
jgi:SNF2 family DNA or RNA helicase